MEVVVLQPQAETTKQATDVAQNTPAKVDFATDLFDMLSMDGPSENGSEAVGATADDNNWAGFQCMFYLTFFFYTYYELMKAGVDGHLNFGRYFW